MSCVFVFSDRHLEEDMITAELYNPASNYIKKYWGFYHGNLES